MRGRKPLPTAIKRLRGNPGKGPLNEREPVVASAIPVCPAHLDDEAKHEWRRITRELKRAGLVTRLDRAALAAYCQAWSRWIDAEQKIRTAGAVVLSPKKYPMLNPYLVVANRAMAQMRQFLTEFGMTPSARSRVHTDATPDSEAAEMEAFLFKPRREA
jgi:P27 family predicted phage terminase small subunit